MIKKHEYTNRLAEEKSPYLQQHAHNPVDWFPWGSEAIDKARELDKPIFLSIGYATCHWCHVMERESFESPEIAEKMNAAFVNIKVDREELPEIDSLYMEIAQSMMKGAAGWPLNVVLTPALLPFFAATYLPPKAAHGLIGLSEVIARITDVWHSEERPYIEEQSKKILDLFNDSIHIQGDSLPAKEIVADAADLLFKLADPVYGGMKGSPKFPIGYHYNFLLRYFARKQESRALFITEKTLDMMQRGGIYDHLGGGFSRYSVDEHWQVPHFEKMLYDNALLVNSYLEAWQVTKNPFYQKVCKEVLEYVFRELRDSQSGFLSAEDADSEGHEGLYYTWTYDEVAAVLGKEESCHFCEFYGLTPEGSFEGRNILHITRRLPEYAENKALPIKELEVQFEAQKKKLLAVRGKREHPFKDDKILSSWNGLMIHSAALAGVVFEEKSYLLAAIGAASFIEENMVKDGRLLRRWRDGEAQFTGGLEDYAFLIRAYITLFEVGSGTQWLKKAMDFTEILSAEYKAENGAFYQTDGQDIHLIMRKCQFSDGAEPSGNAVHCENLLRLYQITARQQYLAQAADVFRAVKKYLDNYPPGYCFHAMNLLRYYDREMPVIVIALNENQDHKQEIAALLFNQHLPHKAIIWKNVEDGALVEMCPSCKENLPVEGKTTLYYCIQGACKKALHTFEEIKDFLELLSRT